MSKTDFQNGFALGMASGGVVEVVDTTEIDALETLIDESGVLEGAEGTATEKVEQLIGKVVYELKAFEYIVTANGLFYGVHKFPTKAIVNLPNVNTVYQAFSAWNTEPIPIVEELTVNAPKINVSNSQACMQNMFWNNYGVKKVILNMPDGCKYMLSTFANAKKLEEIVLNFSTKNVIQWLNAFIGCPIKKIVGVLDFSSATDVYSTFAQCYQLEEVRFAPNSLSISISLSYSGKLSAESIQSIIDGLATVETARTLTLNKTIVLTDEQKATINAKGWTLAQ